MKHFSKYLWILISIAVACSDDHEEVTDDGGFAYFPLQVGFYQRYLVSEVRYSPIAEPETLSYELLHQVVDSFRASAGHDVYVIHRSTRPNAKENWQFEETWSARVSSTEALIAEGNTSYVKLALPPTEGGVWNGNRYNNLGEDNYRILALHEQKTVNERSFEHTLTVEQEFNDDPIVYTDIRSEVYAPGAGLVLKETTQLRFCQEQTCSGDKLIESGVILKQEIIEYGVQ